MSMGLTSFLIEASYNPSLVRTLREEPEAIISRHRLSPREVNAILDRNQQKLQESLNYIPAIFQITVPNPTPEPEPELKRT